MSNGYIIWAISVLSFYQPLCFILFQRVVGVVASLREFERTFLLKKGTI